MIGVTLRNYVIIISLNKKIFLYKPVMRFNFGYAVIGGNKRIFTLDFYRLYSLFLLSKFGLVSFRFNVSKNKIDNRY